MLQAQLSRKLSVDDERSEDLLTSNVFGMIRYVPTQSGLVPILSRATGNHGSEFSALLQHVDGVQDKFWPWLEEWPGHGCEPDVMLWLISGQQVRGIVVIEAKYLSGKSSVADPQAEFGSLPRDQLAREWVNAQRLGERERVPVYLVYVTAHPALPISELKDTQHDLARCGLPPARLLWLSWFEIARGLDRSRPLLSDLRDLLEMRYEFRTFDGLRSDVSRLTWRWASNQQPADAITEWHLSTLAWSFLHD